MDKNDVLYEDNHLLIINKKAGQLSQGDKTKDDSLLELGKAYIKKHYNKPGDVFLGLPHRLDRPVSGAIILCRTSKALTRMNKLIADRELVKVYHALVLKKPKDQQGRLESYLRKNRVKNKVDSFNSPQKDAKKAILTYQFLKQIGKYFLIEIKLETGRPHQIRVQLNDMGCPILGDLKYFNQSPLSDKSIGLHARELSFIHPVKKNPINIIAPYPTTIYWRNS
ncbi:MAG: RluA family pseudouridine synthase [Saprospiraceae bacterium]|nr:RluA family pseudouridine synthase [Bacteroidia bacterium]NNL92781.1 RluA family pseudouridine synthase [Saprospiraceae bacterium]